MKLWQKDTPISDAVERFTAGNDREMDLYLARYDVLGSLAHLEMLGKVGLILPEEVVLLRSELRRIYHSIGAGKFELEAGVEDVHSQVELLLTRACGEAGKKIHTGRSRNDQVLTDLKLFFRAEIASIAGTAHAFFDQLQQLSEQYRDVPLPGYTHFQVAMPSSFGLWFGAYSESLVDDLYSLQAAWRLANKNPLGSAAGYGSSFPLNRDLTTELLGFDAPHVNAIAAQMARGKTERVVAQALANLAATLGKLAYDACLFMSQNFGFIGFPDELTTGSSIMPHKKNPDVFELVRARCNALQALPNEIAFITGNLPSGYHRDFQLLKEKLFPAFGILRDCFEMSGLMLQHIRVRTDILDDPRYRYIFTVEEVNRLVQAGVPFRDAYKQVGLSVEQGTFEVGARLPHTHLGSIGNLGTARIAEAMEAVWKGFGVEKVRAAEAFLSEGLHPDMDKSKMAVEVFDKRANDYQAKFMDLDLYHDTFDIFCNNITKENPDILELACGPGNITKYLLKKRPDFKILGTDLAPNMIDLAKINNPSAIFQLMDCRDIDKIDKKYDAIMCGFGLPYLSKEESIKLISDACKLLNAHGVLYLSTMEDDYSKSGLQRSSYGDEAYIHYHQADYLTKALQENSFRIIDIQRKDYPTTNETKITDLVIIAVK